MKQPFILFTLCLLLQPLFLPAQQNPQHLAYIIQYKNLAIEEMLRVGIPASITLAQGILESNAGQSELARMANNHFGIKCGSGWAGETYQKKDDDYGSDGFLTYSCFRSYPDAEGSFDDHSDFLTAARYQFLFQLDNTNYRGWAYGLKQAGYATSPSYPQKLIDIIERYGLHQYDLVFPARDTSYVIYPLLTTTTNKVPQTFASGQETAEDIAYRSGVPLKKLLDYNEGLVNGYVLPRGEKIYLASKGRSFSGPLEYHEVEPGESTYDIAQKYGIRLDKLLARNRLEPGQQPEPGEQLKLQGQKVAAPPSYDEEASPAGHAPLPVLLHQVKKGDTLWNIAQRYDTTIEELKRLNSLESTKIIRGMLLRLR